MAMRLTLRTLLAYIDGVLPADDAAELESKIRESRIAQSTMERIDHSMARKDLSANSAMARSAELDANTVAEYLDNTMSPETLPSFEKACFENDIQLVEVAAVHRILSNVLTKPVRVEESLRQRLRTMNPANSATGEAIPIVKQVITDGAVGNAGSSNSAEQTATDTVSGNGQVMSSNGRVIRLDNSHQPATAEQAAPTVAVLQTTTPVLLNAESPATRGLDLTDDRTNAVPEYLRDRSEGMWSQALIAGGLVAAMLVVGYIAIGSIDDLKRMFTNSKPIADASLTIADETKAPAQASASIPAASVPEADIEESGIASADIAPPLAPVEAASTETTTIEEVNDTTIPPVQSVALESGEAIVSSDVAPPGVSVETADVAPPMAAEIEASDMAPPDVASVSADAVAPPVPGVDAVAPTTSTPSLITWQPETKESSAAVVMGMQVDPESEKDPTRYADRKLRLLNVADVAAIEERIVVPTAYRTELRIQPGIKWVVASATDIRGLQGSEPKQAYVDFRLGRALLHSSPDCLAITIRIHSHEYQIEFQDPASVASIELKYYQLPGVSVTPPEQGQAIEQAARFVLPIVTIGNVTGACTVKTRSELTWSDADTLAQGEAVVWQEHERQAKYVVNEIPWWYRTSIERPIDAGAAEDLSLELQTVPPENIPPNAAGEQPDAAVDLIAVLREATHLRRAETAALAARTLALLGDYVSIFGKDGILNQSNSRPHRAQIIDAVIQSIGVSEARRIALASMLKDYDPPRGDHLLTLLSLPSDEALDKPDAAQPYIDALSSSFLDERVLAIYQLTQIVGNEHTYQPDRVTSEALATWRKLHRSGKIDWSKSSTQPFIIPPHEPVKQ